MIRLIIEKRYNILIYNTLFKLIIPFNYFNNKPLYIKVTLLKIVNYHYFLY